MACKGKKLKSSWSKYQKGKFKECVEKVQRTWPKTWIRPKLRARQGKWVHTMTERQRKLELWEKEKRQCRITVREGPWIWVCSSRWFARWRPVQLDKRVVCRPGGKKNWAKIQNRHVDNLSADKLGKNPKYKICWRPWWKGRIEVVQVIWGQRCSAVRHPHFQSQTSEYHCSAHNRARNSFKRVWHWED